MKKILVVGMADSVHLARWLRQFEKIEGYDIALVSSSPHRRVHPIIRGMIHSGRIRMGWLTRFLSLPIWVADRVLADFLRGSLIAFYSVRFRPDLIHVNEFQNAGYSYLKARAFSRRVRAAKLLVTPYGSDIYWFQQYPKHLKKIKALLAHTDAISAECRRDELLARKYGFQGVFCPRISAFGALEVDEERALGRVRQTIAIKGYQNHWGQALIAIDVVRSLASELSDFTIELFSCNRITVRAGKKLSRETGLQVRTYPKGALTNSQVHDIMHRSVAVIALSKSDGQSASMVEAMVNGAVPIQSRTSCSDEWLEDGVGGFLVDYDDKTAITKHLKFIIDNPSFRESAARHNVLTLADKLTPEKTEGLARATYEIVINA